MRGDCGVKEIWLAPAAALDEILDAVVRQKTRRIPGQGVPAEPIEGAERQPANGSPWLDADGAAAHLATSRDRIYDLVQVRALHPHRDGRRLLFRREDLDRYLEDSR